MEFVLFFGGCYFRCMLSCSWTRHREDMLLVKQTRFSCCIYLISSVSSVYLLILLAYVHYYYYMDVTVDDDVGLQTAVLSHISS
jgi:Trk-type K+ transport system membrane component